MTAEDTTNLRRQINRILYNDWDPIRVNGCAPGDEYSSYVPSFLRLLQEGATVQQISDLLHQIADEYMCMNTNSESNTLVAKKLHALMMMMDNTTGSNNQVIVVDERAARLEDERLFIPPVIQQQPSSIVSAEDRLGYQISAILFNDWDPIGMNDHGLLPDEYDIYVPSILRLFQDGANEQQISEQLQTIASEKLGMHTKAQVNLLVAKKLRALMILENQVVDEGSTSIRLEYDRDRSYSPPDIQRSSSLLPPNVSADDDRLRCQISSILFHDWNPIGCLGDGMPSDEYDDYVPSILRLLKDGANVQQISLELHQIAEEYIGLNTNAQVNTLAAKKLRALMENEVIVDERNYTYQPDEYNRRYSPVFHHGLYDSPPPIASTTDDRRLRDKINDILYYAWDPIGTMKHPSVLLPRDEYECYVPSVLRLLKEGGHVQEISKLLHKIAKADMNIDTKADVNTLVAMKLRALFHGYSSY